MHKVISYTDGNYFKFGEPFLMTRKLVKGRFVVYGSQMAKGQVQQLKDNDIEFQEIDTTEFESKMQFLKFKLLIDNIDGKEKGITFVDFDTYFLNDWGHIFEDEFSLGVCVRNKFMKRKGPARAYSNGGVIFCSQIESARDMCEYAMKVMENGRDEKLPEYDAIWNTLENGRPDHKTHYRTNLRWWVDQVFLSCFPMRYMDVSNLAGVKDRVFIDFENFRVGLFNCDRYNHLDPSPGVVKDRMVKKRSYIMHMKSKGRGEVKDHVKVLSKIIGSE